MSQQNAYNRVFNGVGWAAEGVAAWPAANYNERVDYFTRNRAALQAGNPIVAEFQLPSLVGTSFWPTGNDILNSGDAARIAAMNVGTSAGAFIHLVARPATLIKLANAAYRVAESSDYSLTYIRLNAASLAGPWTAVFAPIRAIQRHLWLIFSLICITSAALNRDIAAKLCAVYLAACCPPFVVAGDGFLNSKSTCCRLSCFFHTSFALLATMLWKKGARYRKIG